MNTITAARATLFSIALILPFAIAQGNTIREDGVLIVNGKPTFLLGIYQGGLDTGRYENGILVNDIETIAAAGFNFIHTSLDHTFDGFDDWDGETPAQDACMRAKELGIFLGDSLHLENPDFLQIEVAGFHEDSDAIIVTSIGDDFNTDANGGIANDWELLKVAPDRMHAIHASVKAEAPNQITYSSGLSFASENLVLEDYMVPRAMDLIATQHYPIGDGNYSPDYEWEAMDDLCESYWIQGGSQASKAFIANPQSFQWPGGRWITAKEMRLQAYIQLLHRVKGLVWYNFEGYDGQQPLPVANPSLWSEFQALIPELRQLEAVLTEGRFTGIENPANPYYESFEGQGTWHAGYWEYQGHVYAVVVNTHKTASQTIDFTLPNVGDAAATLMFSNSRYGEGMLIKDCRLQGTVHSGDVHVYRIPMTSTVREDGVLMVKGEPTFLLGIYQGGLDTGRYQNGVLVGDIETIAAAGFSFVQTSMDHTFDGFVDWGGETPASDACVRAKELGVFLGDSIYLGNPAFLETEVSEFHEAHEAIILSSIGDSFNWSDTEGITNDWESLNMAPDRMRAFHDRVKAESKGQITYSSGLSFASEDLVLEDYMVPRAMDLIATQHYPIGDGNFGPDYEWEAMDDLCEGYWEQGGPQANRAYIVNPQCFRWPGGRWITAREMRLQAYSQLLHRVRGLVWSAFDGPDGPLPEANPSLWTEFQALIPELRQLESILTEGRFTSIENPDNPYFESFDGQGTWHAGYWEYQGHVYAVVVNTHKTESKAINFALPNVEDGAAMLMFSNSRYGEGLLIEDGRLQGTINSGDVHVYRLPVELNFSLNLQVGPDTVSLGWNQFPGYRSVLKYSTDLRLWTPLNTVEVAGDRPSFVHSDGGNSGFYRVDAYTR